MKKIILLFLLFLKFGFSQDSIPKSKLSVISLDRIKVVYRGIENPITIAVPNNVKSFLVSGNGVYATKEVGKYIVKPGIGIEMIVKVEMILNDNSLVVEEHKYQIKGLPAPIGTLNNEYSTRGEIKFTKKEFKDAEIGIKFIDFLPNIQFKTISFLITSNKKEIKIEGNKINEQAFNFIKKLKKNSIIVISEIRYPHSVESIPRKVEPIVIKIVD